MKTLNFSGGARLEISDTGKRGTYSFNGKSTEVEVEGVDNYGGATFKNSKGIQFYQDGTRPMRLTPLTTPIYSPKELPARPSAPGNPPTAQPGYGWRQGNMNRGSRPPVATEYRLGPGAGWAHKPAGTPAPPQTNSIPWMARGSNLLPANPGWSATGAITLFDVTVPTGYVLRLTQYFLGLAPSALWEDNLIWKLRVGSIDLFNPFNSRGPSRDIYGFSGPNTFWTGRPVRENVVVPFSMIKDDLITVQPGERITLTVELVDSWPGGKPSDVISGALFGSLWGNK